MTGQTKPRGITLVEVVVVVIILVILLSLLLPGINSGGGGRRNTCANNMRQLALAVQMYEQHHQAYPGYANVIRNKRASWVVPLLPYIERYDLYGIWQKTEPVPLPLPAGNNGATLDAEGSRPNPWVHTQISILICPSNHTSDIGTNPLSFVANCGSARTANDNLPPLSARNAWAEDVNSGVFFNHAGADANAEISQPNPNPPLGSFSVGVGPTITMSFIANHDGTSYTLLLSENLQATNWVTDPSDQMNHPANPFQSEFQIKQNTGFVWFITGYQDNGDSPSRQVGPSAMYNRESIRINAMAKTLTNPVRIAYSSSAAPMRTGGASGQPAVVTASRRSERGVL